MLMIMCYYQHLSVSKNVFKFVNSLHLSVTSNSTQLIMFVIKTHNSIKLYFNRSPLLWVERSNLGTYIHIDHACPVSCNIEKFYGQFKFNSIDVVSAGKIFSWNGNFTFSQIVQLTNMYTLTNIHLLYTYMGVKLTRCFTEKVTLKPVSLGTTIFVEYFLLLERKH